MLGILAGASIVSSFLGDRAARKAAGAASASQTAAAELGIDEQRKQYEELQKLLAPYTAAVADAVGAQRTLAGLGGQDALSNAIKGIEGGPQFQSLIRQGENAILQNASATGGLRGGNTQSALAQFRPDVLSQLIEAQYAKLGGIAGQGLQASGIQGQAGGNAAQQIAALRGDQGAAQAGNALARGQATTQLLGNLSGSLGNYAALSKLGGF